MHSEDGACFLDRVSIHKGFIFSVLLSRFFVFFISSDLCLPSFWHRKSELSSTTTKIHSRHRVTCNNNCMVSLVIDLFDTVWPHLLYSSNMDLAYVTSGDAQLFIHNWVVLSCCLFHTDCVISVGYFSHIFPSFNNFQTQTDNIYYIKLTHVISNAI